MTITSQTFVIFVLVVLGIYYLLPRRGQNYWLLAASYLFHITWAWQFALILFSITVVNFFLARQLVMGKRKKTALLWVGIVFNVLALIFFRVENFFVPEIVSFLTQLGVQTKIGGLQILVPIGLSFYILENISYLLDVYRGQTDPVSDMVDFALYLAYFPKLLAGPIERARSFLPKLERKRIVDNTVLASSFTLIVIGAVRKLVIADTLAAAIPLDVFESPSNFFALELWGWLIVYAFLIYNDFAGYTSIVRGVSGLFGIEMSPNFETPYFSHNFSEFWNRWHITLSHWLRDYIFFLLGRALMRRLPNRENPLNLLIPPIATMFVSGLWHGLSCHMLLWGGLHGLYLVFERVLSLRKTFVPQHQQGQARWRKGIVILIVFFLCYLRGFPSGWMCPSQLSIGVVCF